MAPFESTPPSTISNLLLPPATIGTVSPPFPFSRTRPLFPALSLTRSVNKWEPERKSQTNYSETQGRKNKYHKKTINTIKCETTISTASCLISFARFCNVFRHWRCQRRCCLALFIPFFGCWTHITRWASGRADGETFIAVLFTCTAFAAPLVQESTHTSARTPHSAHTYSHAHTRMVARRLSHLFFYRDF